MKVYIMSLREICGAATARDACVHELKAGDTPSSSHVSSCDVTRAVGMWLAI